MWVGTPKRIKPGSPKQAAVICELSSMRPNNLNSLRENEIESVQADSDGFLWIGEQHGLNRLNPGNWRIYVLPARSLKTPHSLSYNQVAAHPGRPVGHAVVWHLRRRAGPF